MNRREFLGGIGASILAVLTGSRVAEEEPIKDGNWHSYVAVFDRDGEEIAQQVYVDGDVVNGVYTFSGWMRVDDEWCTCWDCYQIAGESWIPTSWGEDDGRNNG